MALDEAPKRQPTLIGTDLQSHVRLDCCTAMCSGTKWVEQDGR